MNYKESKINQVRIGAVLSYINMAIGSLIPMFYTPIMLQCLGQDEYGLYRLAGSVISYLSLISFGIGSAVVRYFTKYRTEGDKKGEQNIFGLFNIIFWIISLITIIVGVILSICSQFIYGDSLADASQINQLQILVIILTINSALSFFTSPYSAVVTSHERFFFLQCMNILLTIITPLINLVALFLGFKSIGLVCSSFIINIIATMIYIFYVRTKINIRPKYNNIPKHLIKEILLFSFWVFVANIVNQLYNTTDILIIGAIPALGTIGVAIYNVGITFNSMMTNISLGMLNVLTPKVNSMVFSNSNNTELTDLMIKIGRLQCYIVSIVCSGFIVFGMPFIYVWAGDGYEDAYWVAFVTMIPACVPLVQNVALNVIVAKNKHRFRSLLYLFIAVFNVVGTIIFVKPFGVIGAAAVSGISFVIGQIFIMNWYYWKRIGLEIPRFWKSVSPIYIIPVIMIFITLLISNYVDFYNVHVLIIGIIIYAAVFSISNWLFIMNDYEKDIFRAPIKKIVRKLKIK